MVRDSTGGGSTAKMTVYYTLSYRLCHTRLGSGRGLFDVYDDMVAIAAAFLDAVLAIDVLTGAVDIMPSDAVNFGPVVDPAGDGFHGCDFALDITEFVN